MIEHNSDYDQDPDPDQHIRVGIDIGGTFTDFVIHDPSTGQLKTFKLLSTPHHPAQAVLAGLEMSVLTDEAAPVRIVHGSTVATNALLEHKGAPAALVTTRGFRDVLQIGRQHRPALYDLFADPQSPLVPAEWRLEVDERVDHTGHVLQPLNPAQVDRLIPFLHAQRISSVAVCLLFSFLHPQHEQIIADHLRQAGFFVSASSEILPEYREYERTSTTVVNAYVSPILDRYIAQLEQALHITLPSIPLAPATQQSPPATAQRLGPIDLRIMQSNGGSIRTSEARRNGVRCIVSGPAGGVVGALHMARLASAAQPDHETAQSNRIITFDMGGTSTDVSLCEGDVQTTTEANVGGYPVRIPIIDIHTVGAGGGSIASVDLGGALRVGPESAGADPGPACYGRSDLPTVTDANVVLGRLPGRYFLGGQMQLDEARARRAIATLGATLGLDATQIAQGIVEVVNAHMERALRVISVERGYDPCDFTLVSFGGAGGLHAAGLARRLGIPRVLVSPLAATLSAFGMLAADVVRDYAQTVMLPGDASVAELQAHFAPLVERGRREVLDEGVAPQNVTVERLVDMRYRGQSYELSIPFGPRYHADFHSAHQHAYSYARAGAPTEIVNVRVKVTGHIQPPPVQPMPAVDRDPAPALLECRPVILDTTCEVPFYDGDKLRPGHLIAGPAIIVRPDTTVLIGASDRAQVDGYRNLFIHIGA